MLERHVNAALTGGSGDDGLVQRFGLVVWPDEGAPFEYVDRAPDAVAEARARAVFAKVDTLPSCDDGPTVWRFDDEAQSDFAEWLTGLESTLRDESLPPALVSHLAKFRRLVPALALLCRLASLPSDFDPLFDAPTVGIGDWRRAVRWGDYLRSHAERLYSAAMRPGISDAHRLLAKLRAGALADGDGVLAQSFTARQLANRRWATLGDASVVTRASEILVDHGWLSAQEVRPVGGGRPTVHYRLHSTLLAGTD